MMPRAELLDIAAFEDLPPPPLHNEEPTLMPVLIGGRKCVTCGKKLRSHNRSDTCWNCRTSKWGSKKVAEAPPAPAKALKPPRKVRAFTEPRGDAVGRFKVVADALGFDGGQMLEDFAQSWLDRLQHAATGGSLPNKPRQLPMAPVRLQSTHAGDARLVDDEAGAGT